MAMDPNFRVKLESFVAGCQRIITEYFKTHFKNLSVPTLVIEPGRRYVRIMKVDGQEMAYCFVDQTNGDVLKPAGWRAPAKHARGNIYADDNGLSRMLWTGPEYLR